MKISVEPMKGFSFNVPEGTSKMVGGIRVEWQSVKGGKRAHTNIVMDSEEPADMLRTPRSGLVVVPARLVRGVGRPGRPIRRHRRLDPEIRAWPVRA